MFHDHAGVLWLLIFAPCINIFNFYNFRGIRWGVNAQSCCMTIKWWGFVPVTSWSHVLYPDRCHVFSVVWLQANNDKRLSSRAVPGMQMYFYAERSVGLAKDYKIRTVDSSFDLFWEHAQVWNKWQRKVSSGCSSSPWKWYYIKCLSA